MTVRTRVAPSPTGDPHVGTAYIRAFIPAQAEPVKRIQDGLFRLGSAAGLVGILDAQQELAPVGAGKTHVEQGDVGGAYVA